jgi:hypothetical protein
MGAGAHQMDGHFHAMTIHWPPSRPSAGMDDTGSVSGAIACSVHETFLTQFTNLPSPGIEL